MLNIDWNLVKVQYELFGAEVNDLAEAYQTSPRMIEYAVKEHKWERKPLAAAACNWDQLSDLSLVDDTLIDEVTKHLQVLHTLKLSALHPSYIALETAIVTKALMVVQGIAAEDPQAAEKLKSITAVLESLGTRSGVGPAKQQEQAPSLRVMVMGQVDENGRPRVSAAVEAPTVKIGHA